LIRVEVPVASKTFAIALLSSLALAALAGCGKVPAEGSQRASKTSTTKFEADPSAAPSSPAPSPARRTALVAAAERFENLTEAAFSPNPGEVAKRTALANAAGAAVRQGMSPDHGAGLDAALGKIGLAAKSKNAVDLSLASNEAYRAVLSEAGGETGIPLDIGLLDYAGFRITADARDPKPRWDDVREALGFANQRWNAVKPLIHDPKVADQFDRALVWVQEALAAKDAKSLERAATRELDLVDLLETAVKPK
jgi:hypothetical protein